MRRVVMMVPAIEQVTIKNVDASRVFGAKKDGYIFFVSHVNDKWVFIDLKNSVTNYFQEFLDKTLSSAISSHYEVYEFENQKEFLGWALAQTI